MILYNKTQIECIEHPPAPLMIIAGAGTGKTTTIVGRIAHFIKKHEIEPNTILALTYTVKAAEHLKNEISKAVGSEHDHINALNFHSFALDHTLEYFDYLGYTSTPELIESNESKYIINNLIIENTENFISSVYRKNNELAYITFSRIFSQLNDELIYGKDLIKKYESVRQKIDLEQEDMELIDAIYIYFKYQEFKKEKNLIDFGDMLVNLWILLNDVSIHAHITSSIHHIVVDEFQDNNFALTEIVKKISGNSNSITVVGDDDQSIYSFRGANNQSFNSFREKYSNADGYKEIILTLNYRSTQSILNFAHESVKNIENRLKSVPLISNSNDDCAVKLYEGNRLDQLDEMTKQVSSYLKRGVPESEICVLARSRSGCIEVSKAFNESGIANSYHSGKFFENEEVKDFISFINIIENGVYRDLGLYRLLSKTLEVSSLHMTSIVRHSLSYIDNNNLEEEYGDLAKNKLLKWIKMNRGAADRNNIVETFDLLYQDIYGHRINVSTCNHLRSMVDRYLNVYKTILDSTLCSYMNSLFDLNETYFDSVDSDDDSVQIMTVHQSKGMEFDYVIVPFLSSGTFPSSNKKSKVADSLPLEWSYNKDKEEDNYDEERRIFHVAVTRARKKLSLFAPEKRRSKFFKEISCDSFKEEKISPLNKFKELDKSEMIFKYKNIDKYSFSATSLSLYESCPLAYKYRMYDRLKSPGYSPDAIFGIFIHNILEKIYQTDQSDKDSILLVLEDEWDELRFDSLTQSNEYKKEALNLLNDYFKENPIDRDIRYVLEKEFSAFIGDVEFRGKLDRIDVNTSGEMQIIDYKTSQKKKTQKSIIKDLQLPYYFFLLSRSTDDESKFEISSGKFEYVRHAESPSVEIQLNKDDIDRVEDRVRNISSSVQRSVFTPKKNSICYYCEFKRLLCPLYK